MTISIAFIMQRKVIRFQIKDRIITYFDENWKDGIQFMPLDREIYDRLRSGKMQMKLLAALILDANSGRNLKEYKEAKNDQELAEIIRKECKIRGLLEVK